MTPTGAGERHEGALVIWGRDVTYSWAGYICGVFFFLGPGLATLLLPLFLLCPTGGSVLGLGILAGGGGFNSESGWVRFRLVVSRVWWCFAGGGWDISVSG